MLRYFSFIVIGGVLVFAAAFYVAHAWVIDQTPKIVMSNIEARISDLAGGVNMCLHNRNYGPRSGSVARANPDSIVTSMVYDLSDGPVQFSGTTWPQYWSLSVYQHNTDNIFVINDRQLPTDAFQIVLVEKGQVHPDLASAIFVESPSVTGIVLIRRFVPHPEDMANVLLNQDVMVCGLLKKTTAGG